MTYSVFIAIEKERKREIGGKKRQREREGESGRKREERQKEEER